MPERAVITISFVAVIRIFRLCSAGWTDGLLEQTIASPAVRRVLAIVVETLCLVFVAVFVYEACMFVEASASERSPVFGYPRLYW